MTKAILLLMLVNCYAHAETTKYEDMVPVYTPEKEFYIDIFEASFKDLYDLVFKTKWTNLASPLKPARASLKSAYELCKAKGKRLPTLKEWLEAASNCGKNKKFTLINENNIQDSEIPSLANVQSQSGSEEVYNFSKLGIDAIGTTGMTGNRYEWVIAEEVTQSDGTKQIKPGLCGGQNETKNISEITLDSICLTNFDYDFDKNDRDVTIKIGNISIEGATARCVVDIDSEDNYISFSKNINGKLKQYLMTTYPYLFPELQTNIDLPTTQDQKFIPANSYSTISDPTDKTLLEEAHSKR